MGRVPYIWSYVHNKILEISSVSTTDWINITAHYTALHLNMQDDEAALRKRGIPEANIQYALQAMPKTSFKINGLKFTVPLTRFKDETLGYLLLLLEQFEKGNLPFEGPISEQPAQIIEIFGILRQIKSELNSREQREPVPQKRK